MFSIKRNVVDEPIETVEIEIVQAREKVPETIKST
jgi:hypothetical protein